MANELNGRSVAVLATDGVEQVELTEPVKALKAAGATVHVVSPKVGSLQGWNHHDKADPIPVDQPLEGADPGRYDALLLPGGVVNPDELRLQPKAIEFIRHFVQSGKPIAALNQGITRADHLLSLKIEEPAEHLLPSVASLLRTMDVTREDTKGGDTPLHHIEQGEAQ